MPSRSMTKPMSPIAPRRSSSLVVPSSTTVTSLPSAHSANWSAKRAFVTRYFASNPIGSRRSSSQSAIGLPPTGSSAFGRSRVSG